MGFMPERPVVWRRQPAWAAFSLREARVRGGGGGGIRPKQACPLGKHSCRKHAPMTSAYTKRIDEGTVLCTNAHATEMFVASSKRPEWR